MKVSKDGRKDKKVQVIEGTHSQMRRSHGETISIGLAHIYFVC